MTKGYVSAAAGCLILLGHLGLIPLVAFMDTLLPNEKMEILLLIGPVTAASAVTIVQFSMKNAALRLGETEVVNIFFVFVSIVIPLAMLAVLYGTCIARQSGALTNADDLKTALSIAEIFLGASYALVVDGLFGSRPLAP